MKNMLILGIVLLMAGCGGSNRFEKPGRAGPRTFTVMPSANGPLKNACLASDRKARSQKLCGCIQAVADQSLSNRDQRRAVGFYSDPHEAQDVRQSKRSRDETFWKAYTTYAENAQKICR